MDNLNGNYKKYWDFRVEMWKDGKEHIVKITTTKTKRVFKKEGINPYYALLRIFKMAAELNKESRI